MTNKDFLDIKIGFPEYAEGLKYLGCAAVYDIDHRAICLEFPNLHEDCILSVCDREGNTLEIPFFDFLFGALEHEMIHDVLFQLFGKEVCLAFDNVADKFEEMKQ